MCRQPGDIEPAGGDEVERGLEALVLPPDMLDRDLLAPELAGR